MNKILRLSGVVVLSIGIASCFHNSDEEAPSLSGIITASPGNATDSDVNDLSAPIASNNTPFEAQVLPNPVTVGGFVTLPDKVGVGRFADSPQGDVYDFYSLTLLAGQTVTLKIGDRTGFNFENDIGEEYDAADLANKPGNIIDLHLLDSNQNQVATTVGNDAASVKSVTAPATGQYYVQVESVTGASDYLLITGLPVGQSSATAASNNSDLNIAHDFVPGEVIVQYKNNPTLAAANVSAYSQGDFDGLQTKAGAPGRSMLMSIGGGAQRQQTLSALNVQATQSYSDPKTQLKYETLEVVKALRARDDVEYAKPNYIRQAALVPNDASYNAQWNLPLINLPQAWEFTTGSSDVIVAVIDTGILPAHPDIGADRLVAGFDFIRDLENAGDGNGIDSDPFDSGESGIYHGTHVTGIIAAETNNDMGVAGVAWNVRIMPLRVLGDLGGTDYDIEQAVSYAAGLPNDAETAAQTAARVAAGEVADVINLSLGGPTGSIVAPEAYRRAREQGVIIVAAAGNDSSSGWSYPASLEGVVSVSAVDSTKTITDYSNIGSTIDVAAPGGTFTNGIYSTWAENIAGSLSYIYADLRGTSMAAPHVAGVAALMKSRALENGNDLTPQFFDVLLANGNLTEDLGDPGRDDAYGYGVIDANLAVQAATMTVEDLDPMLVAAPISLHFGSSANELQFTLSNGGGGVLTVSQPINLPLWLSVVQNSVDPVTGLGVYTAQISRDLLPPQPTVGWIVPISYEATDMQNNVTTGTLNLPVMVYTRNFTADAGYHYVLLYAVNDLGQIGPDATRELGVSMSEGVYRYRFFQVPAGRYVITAGSDLNNNNSISDVPDAKGDYPFLGRISIIEVGGDDIRGLDFVSGYNFYYDTRPEIFIRKQ